VALLKTVRSIEELRGLLAEPRAAGKSIGLVPTMGFFHEGHQALMRRSRERDGAVVVSLYVNPTQFGPSEDYLEYPRDFGRDERMAQDVGVDVLFAPPDEEMYPPGDTTLVEVTGDLTARLCGQYRPGHFRGVATVVTKLLNVVQPHRAYFGEKDYQQLLVVRRLVQDLHLPVEIIGVPTVREADGLAMSSRNTTLTAAGRRAAAVLYRSLERARELAAAGASDARELLAATGEIIAREPSVKLQYAELADAATLAPIDRVTGRAVLAVAAYVDGTRLIDNIIIGG
jgi:pantoate--beta-alanine ligase